MATDTPAGSQSTLAELTNRVLRHRDERNWAQFHNPKELAISLCVESAELLELMQWKTGPELDSALAGHREVRAGSYTERNRRRAVPVGFPPSRDIESGT